MTEGIKIVSLTSKNVLRLNTVEITPDPEGDLIIIGGDNAQGKTSVLDSIMLALGGRKAKHQEPLKRDKKKGEVTVQLTNGLIVTRKFTRKTNTLTITNEDGEKFTAPQQILDKFTSSLTFDPLSFLEMDKHKQQQTVKDLAGLDFKLLDKEKKDWYETRSDEKKQVKVLEGKIEGIVEHKDVPMIEVNVAELMDELTDAQAHNEDIKDKHDEVSQLKSTYKFNAEVVTKNKDQILDLIAEIENLKIVNVQLSAEMEKVKAEGKQLAADIPDSILVLPIQTQIATAGETNKKIASNNKLAQHKTEIRKLEGSIEDLSDRIQEIDEKKELQIKEAAFPIEGLGFDEDGITFNKTPFSQSSHAEQLRISLAMGISLNPDLKVILIRSGSRLDKSNLRLVAEMASESGHQVWIERVGDGDECQVIMEDGYVKE